MIELTRTWSTRVPDEGLRLRLGVERTGPAIGRAPSRRAGSGLLRRLQLAVLVFEVIHGRIDALAPAVPLDGSGRPVIALGRRNERRLDRGRIGAGGDHRLRQKGE